MLTVEARQAALSCIVFSADVVAVFEAQLAADHPTLHAEGIDPLWSALVADWHRDLWFSVGDSQLNLTLGQQQRMVWTRVGTRLGCPLADLISALGFAVLQRDLADSLLQQGLVWELSLATGGIFVGEEALGAVVVGPACYMDDAAIPVCASTSVELFEQARAVADTLLNVAGRHCLHVISCRRQVGGHFKDGGYGLA